ncbi:MAG: Sapep family Mn(2+)-dependent dipeptidase [Clostridia bacterium]|nr:Sapep family Mn(2+)-dependent dipeptidase [Clostridia bacterium]
MDSMEKINALIDGMQDQMVDTLRRWISVPSLKAEPAPNAPFGPVIRTMLDMAVSDCEALGFETEVFDGYAAHADLGEGGDADALGILAHLDVVPVGDGWNYPPYGAEIVNGRMYGRGTSDDKGPAVAALFAMKAVKDAGIPLRRKVRLILGCDEESGSECMEYYKKVATMPRSGFSPDASYPIINIEKGILRIHLSAALPQEGLRVVSFNVGERPNVVPGKAAALVEGGKELIEKAAALSEELGFPIEAETEGDLVRLTAIGVNGHAAYPHLARNAIGEMLLALRALGAKGSIGALAEKVGMEYDGDSMKIAMRDCCSGALTCSLGIIRAGADGVQAVLDIRYPVMCNPEMIVKNVRAAFPGFRVDATEPVVPHYVPESSELVQKLLDAYCEVTGYERKCLYTGGGTYAKELEEGVAFGATFPQDEDLAHQANEYIDLENLFKNAKIFASAIVKLAGKA